MTSNRQVQVTNGISFFRAKGKTFYVIILSVLAFLLLLDYVPGMHAYSEWVTPPVALFLGLLFAICYNIRW